LDGFLGTDPATWIVRPCGLPLISKLRPNAALSFPYSRGKPRRDPTRRSGDKLDYRHRPSAARCQRLSDGEVVSAIDQLTVWHKDFPDPLNRVVVLKTNRRTQQRAPVRCFSPDLSRSAAQIRDYDRRRFPIEFNFRAAQPYWGLEDFMNVTPTARTHAANRAFRLVNRSAALRLPYRQHPPDFSPLDLKSQFRARRYLHETIQSFPDPPSPAFLSRLWRRLSTLGGIHLLFFKMLPNWRRY
jgi:hypothetical protein